MAEHAAVPKQCGFDAELGCFIEGSAEWPGQGPSAASALLAEIKGLPASPRVSFVSTTYGSEYSAGQGDGGESGAGYGAGHGAASAAYNPNDWGRKFLPSNGGSAYVDCNHPELASPEVHDAHEFTAMWHAMLRIAQGAWRRANTRLRPAGRRMVVLVNNSDGHGHAYGSHLNFLLSTRCFRNILHRKLHQLIALAAHQISSICYTGAGKVGSENGRPPVNYQLAQRADFFEQLTSVDTMFHRGVVNLREESHAKAALARLHCIFFDAGLCHAATLLKAGTMQLFLAMLERDEPVADVLLDDPLPALLAFSHDPMLQAKGRMVSGAEYTAVELQQIILDKAAAFVAAGKAEGMVPRAPEIIALWADTLEKLRRRDLPELARRLDWAAKLMLIEGARAQAGLAWDAPELKTLDHLYSSLNPAEGLYWALEKNDAVERLVTDDEIEHFTHEPPEETRAWLRAQMLRRMRPAALLEVDWEVIRFRAWAPEAHAPCYYALHMPDPARFSQADCNAALEAAGNFREALGSLGLQQTDYWGRALCTDDKQEDKWATTERRQS